MKLETLTPFVLASLLLAPACASSSSSGSPDASPQDAHSDATSSTDTGPSPDGTASNDGALDATAVDAGGDAAEAAPQPTCGAPPNRFTLLAGADSGLVRDNVTELVWMSNSIGMETTDSGPLTQYDAAAYCKGRGMRLPTKEEADALAASYASCAFGGWGTWTSTFSDENNAYTVDYVGDDFPQLADNFPGTVLCVRDPRG